MFTSIHRDKETKLNLLTLQEEQDRPAVEVIRGEAQLGQWICEECRHEVAVRAGEVYRWHFAHQAKSDCPRQHESPGLLVLRATLFRWLDRKFPGRVEIEHKVNSVTLPRPIDCWIGGSDDGPVAPFAYWIYEKGIRNAHERETLLHRLRQLTPNIHFVFTHRFLRAIDPTEIRVPKWLGTGKPYRLSSIEREFIQPTSYDPIYADRSQGSLHYLAPGGEGRLTTLRALRVLHGSQVYAAVPLESALPDLQISRKTGAPVHDGEHAKLQGMRAAAASRPATRGSNPDSSRTFETPQADSTPPTLLTATFRCRVCNAAVGTRDAQLMDYGDKTCTCNRCFWQR